jgi:hypothetical protein
VADVATVFFDMITERLTDVTIMQDQPDKVSCTLKVATQSWFGSHFGTFFVFGRRKAEIGSPSESTSGHLVHEDKSGGCSKSNMSLQHSKPLFICMSTRSA